MIKLSSYLELLQRFGFVSTETQKLHACSIQSFLNELNELFNELLNELFPNLTLRKYNFPFIHERKLYHVIIYQALLF